MSILIYLIIGTIVTFVFEILISSDKTKTGEEKIKFGNFERLVMIIVWPPLLLSFIYHFFKSLKYTVAGFDNTMWPARFIGFGIGMIIYAFGVSYFFNEGITNKTAVSLALALILICIQVLWKNG
jgi:hypothetical protein